MSSPKRTRTPHRERHKKPDDKKLGSLSLASAPGRHHGVSQRRAFLPERAAGSQLYKPTTSAPAATPPTAKTFVIRGISSSSPGEPQPAPALRHTQASQRPPVRATRAGRGAHRVPALLPRRPQRLPLSATHSGVLGPGQHCGVPPCTHRGARGGRWRGVAEERRPC